MKKFVFLLLALLSTCCGTHAREATPPRTTRGAEVRLWREFGLVVHVDRGCPQHEEVLSAASKWRTFTSGRVRFSPVFDVDFESPISLQEHRSRGDALLVCVISKDASAIDDRHPNVRVLAETSWLQKDDSVRVHIITDRIAARDFGSIVMHELGHVAGLEDLAPPGAIMSGEKGANEIPPTEFTDADREQCRAARYCD